MVQSGPEWSRMVQNPRNLPVSKGKGVPNGSKMGHFGVIFGVYSGRASGSSPLPYKGIWDPEGSRKGSRPGDGGQVPLIRPSRARVIGLSMVNRPLLETPQGDERVNMALFNVCK